ncbi:unnamed protein product, partial [Meganyctiphanes norvegica]
MEEDNCHLCHIHDHATSSGLTRTTPLRSSQIRSRHASHSSRHEPAVSTLPHTHGHSSHNHSHIHSNGHAGGSNGHAGLPLNAGSLHRDTLHRQGSTRDKHERVASVLARLSEKSHSVPGSRNSTLTNDHISVIPDGHANPELSFSYVTPDPHNPIRRSKSHRNPFTGHLEHRSPSLPMHVNNSDVLHEPDLLMTTIPRVPGGSRHSTLSRHQNMGHHRSNLSLANDTDQDYYIHATRARYKDDERKQRFNLQTVMLIGCYTMLFVVAIIVGVVLCQQNGWLGFGNHHSDSSKSRHMPDNTRGLRPIPDYTDVMDNRPRNNRMPPDTTQVGVAGVGNGGNFPRDPPQRPNLNGGQPTHSGGNNGFGTFGNSNFDSSGKSLDMPIDPLRAFDPNANGFGLDINNNQGSLNNNQGINNPARGNNQGSINNFGTPNNQPINNRGGNSNNQGFGNNFNNPANANNRGGLP